MSRRDRLAGQLRGFGPIGMAAVLLIIAANMFLAPLGALLVLLWAWLARLPWPELGFRRPNSWLLLLAGGMLGGLLLKLVQKAILMPLLGAPAVNAYFHFIAGNPAAMAKMLIASVIIGGIGEEIFYRGFLFERLGRLWGNSAIAKAATLLLTTIVFGLVHLSEQGVAGAQQAVFTGLVFGITYLLSGRIWLSMVIHSAYNIAAVLIIYWGLETAIAHSLCG
jgi:hypothetical protein